MTHVRPYSFKPDSDSKESEKESEFMTSDSDGMHPAAGPEQLENTDWCECSSCIIMPTVVENICCQEVDALNWRLHELSCGIEHESFKLVCFDYKVLRTAVATMDVAPGSIT